MILFNRNSVLLLLLSPFFIFSIAAKDIQVDRPRGVSLTKKVFYDSSKDFTCFDGSKTVSFSYVNDDYCDCPDGSDEPGTSACPSGSYHCTNAGYRPKNIPSSRVNDGICDCCDGSDEWKNQSLCPNTCIELWKIAREELRKQMDEANAGYLKKQEFSKAGLAKRAERQQSLLGYEEQLSKLKETETILQQEKDEIEGRENLAKEECRKIMEEDLAKKAEEENLLRGARSFAEIDSDKDASVTLNELLAHSELDPDASDGAFTEEEGLAILLKAAVDLDQFMDTVWPHINGTFQTKVPPTAEEQEQTSAEAGDEEREEPPEDAEEAAFREEEIEKQAADSDVEEDDEYYEDDDHGDEEEDDYEEEEEERGLEPPPPPPGVEQYYDETTKQLIETANDVRRRFQENEDKKKKIETEISAVHKALALDFGPDEAFQTLQSQCYELHTKEYKYKLCPFDKTSQTSINGGTETSLGRWGSWSGPEGSKHSKMKYDSGLTCWNGPARSTEVKIRCGIEHRLLSVDEPSRCLYVFEFATPCACAQVEDEGSPDVLPRDEL